MGQIDGKELVTVDDLAEDGTLHPVQQAMVDTARFAMRLLHAGLRHVALRALSFRARRRRGRTSSTRSPAISAAAPAIARSSMRPPRPAPARRSTAGPGPRTRRPREAGDAAGRNDRVLRHRLTASSHGRRVRTRFADLAAEQSRGDHRRRCDRRGTVDHQADARAAASIILVGGVEELHAISDTAGQAVDRRRCDLCGGASRNSRRIDPDIGEVLRRLGSQPGACLRHRRRQYRQWLAHRRHAAHADRAWCNTASAP